MLIIVNGLAFWSVGRALAPFPVISSGLERIQRGDLEYRLPVLKGSEAQAIGTAFNRMAQAVQDKGAGGTESARGRDTARRNGAKWRAWSNSMLKRSDA